MPEASSKAWPIHITDRYGNRIYLTWERWEHALGHPGMEDVLLEWVLEAIRKGNRKQDAFDRMKYKYTYEDMDLPSSYTHVVVVVKFGWRGTPPEADNFVLTAYLIEKW